MSHQPQPQLPKYRFQLGTSNDVIIHLNEDEQSVQEKINGLKFIGAISDDIEPKKISHTAFSFSIPQDRYAIFQKLFSYPESNNSKYGISEFRAKQFIFTNVQTAFEFHECLTKAGFQPFDTVGMPDEARDDRYTVRTLQEFGKVFDCLLPCFIGQGSLDNYLALEEFYHQVLAKHADIFENADLSNNALLKQLNEIFRLSISGEDKFLTLWAAIRKFKKSNSDNHPDLMQSDLKAFIDDIEKVFELDVDMSLNKEDFKSELTLEARTDNNKNAAKRSKLFIQVIDLEKPSSTDLIKTRVASDTESTLCETFFAKHDQFISAWAKSDDVLRICLNKVFFNEQTSDEDKVKSMRHLVLGFEQGGIMSHTNLQSYTFTDFSNDLSAVVSQLDQAIPTDSAQLASLSASSSGSSASSAFASNPHSTFGHGQPETPTQYKLEDGKTVPAKRTYEKMKETDMTQIENEHEEKRLKT